MRQIWQMLLLLQDVSLVVDNDVDAMPMVMKEIANCRGLLDNDDR